MLCDPNRSRSKIELFFKEGWMILARVGRLSPYNPIILKQRLSLHRLLKKHYFVNNLWSYQPRALVLPINLIHLALIMFYIKDLELDIA